MLNEGIQFIDKFTIDNRLSDKLKILNLSDEKMDFILDVLIRFLQTNYVYDQKATKEKIDKALQEVESITTSIKKNQILIQKNDVFTVENQELLTELGIYGLRFDYFKFLGLFVINILLFFLLERFVYYFNFRIYSNKKYFVLTFCVSFLVIILAFILTKVDFYTKFESLKYFIPIPILSMILSTLVTPNISMITGAVNALLISFMYGNDLDLFVYLFLSNCIATFSSYKKYRRSELIYSGYIIGVFNVLIVVSLLFFKGAIGLNVFFTTMMIAFFNGVISSMITLAILPYLETVFTITTNQSLLEICNLNHPLLKQLMLKAPGTYQHSLMVANLSEAAAESINADTVLCRVGAYFHDIGKMKRPIFFVENQFSIENPHKSLTPRMSKRIIASHVKDGIDLAQKYRLPQILQSFITEHHGTSLVSFFYTQAMQVEDQKLSQTIIDEFRYSGPRPSLKETGIVSLADSVEAAVRSMDRPTISKIEVLIEKIFNDKLSDNQLENCPLSMSEITTIKITFLKIFRGIYHTRVDYQDEIKQFSSIEKSK